MLPAVLAIEAFDRGLDIVALTDHNNGRNLPAFSEACSIVGICGIYGMEVNTIEEVHMLSLFETLDEAMDFNEYLETTLPRFKHSSKLFGDQMIVDLEGNEIGRLDMSLYGASSLSVEKLVEQVNHRGGMIIPAHVDRPSDSLLANLGFIPDLPYSAIEAIRIPCEADVHGKTVVQGSDAHYIEHIGRRFCYAEVEQVGFQHLRKAFLLGNVSYR